MIAINDIRQALHEFWSSFTDTQTGKPIPAYHDLAAVAMNNRPNPPSMPYITYEIARPEFSGATIATANIWDRREQPGFYGLIDDVLMQASEKIPEGGVIISLGSGAMIFYRNSTNFTGYLDEPNDNLVTRGIIRYMVYNYIL